MGGRSIRGAHPADRGLVMLTAWIAPALRDRVRHEAARSGRPLSEVVTDALCAGLAVLETPRERRLSRRREVQRAG